jgi:hypothetical protein
MRFESTVQGDGAPRFVVDCVGQTPEMSGKQRRLPDRRRSELWSFLSLVSLDTHLFGPFGASIRSRAPGQELIQPVGSDQDRIPRGVT